jgi:hypothetical protein
MKVVGQGLEKSRKGKKVIRRWDIGRKEIEEGQWLEKIQGVGHGLEERKGGETRLQEVGQELQEKNRGGMSGGKKGRWDKAEGGGTGATGGKREVAWVEERKGGGGTKQKEVGQELQEKNGGDMGEGKKGRWDRGMRREREMGQGLEERK